MERSTAAVDAGEAPVWAPDEEVKAETIVAGGITAKVWNGNDRWYALIRKALPIARSMVQQSIDAIDNNQSSDLVNTVFGSGNHASARAHFKTLMDAMDSSSNSPIPIRCKDNCKGMWGFVYGESSKIRICQQLLEEPASRAAQTIVHEMSHKYGSSADVRYHDVGALGSADALNNASNYQVLGGTLYNMQARQAAVQSSCVAEASDELEGKKSRVTMSNGTREEASEIAEALAQMRGLATQALRYYQSPPKHAQDNDFSGWIKAAEALISINENASVSVVRTLPGGYDCAITSSGDGRVTIQVSQLWLTCMRKTSLWTAMTRHLKPPREDLANHISLSAMNWRWDNE